jgi:hypothetical protein
LADLASGYVICYTVLVKFAVYLIEAPGCWYVGSTKIGAHKRFRQHMRGWGSPSPLLAKKVAEFGPDAFTLTVLDNAATDRFEAERYWYDCMLDEHAGETLNSHRPGSYPEPTPDRNAKIAHTHRGHKHTPETRAKIGAANKIAQLGNTNRRGKKASPETVERNRAAQLGKVLTPEHRANISKARKRALNGS